MLVQGIRIAYCEQRGMVLCDRGRKQNLSTTLRPHGTHISAQNATHAISVRALRARRLPECGLDSAKAAILPAHSESVNIYLCYSNGITKLVL